MEEQIKIQQIIWWIKNIPLNIKQLFCRHEVVAGFTAETFLVDKWERCSGAADCRKCHKDFSVIICANQKEIDSLMGYDISNQI